MTDDFPLEELASLPEFYNPVASPDGTRVAFYYDESGRNELYVLDVESGEYERISDGDVPRSARWGIAWRGDGDAIVFHRDEGGDEQNDLYEMTLDGEVRPLVEFDGQCVYHDESPDGRYVLFTSTAGKQMNLYRYDRETDETDRLTAYDRPVQGAIYSPDGDRVAYVTNESDDLENRDAYVADADGSNPRNLELGEEGSETGVAAWSDEGLLVSDNAADLGRAGIYDPEADDVEWYGPLEHDEQAVTFTPDGDVVAMRTRECAVMPVVYDAPDDDGEEFALPEGLAMTPSQGRGAFGTFLDDGRAVVLHTTPDRRKELYVYDLETGEHDVVLDAEYGSFAPDDFVDAEYVTYESSDHLTIDGLLYDSGERPSPVVVNVHGGPHGQSLRMFSPFTQFLVNRGYSVLQPNYRGSTGRGREFKNRIHGDWGGGEQEDVANGARWLKAQDWVDEDRVAVFGGSYGGYSAYMQLVQYPDLWTTGIAAVGITDLEALYDESMPHFKAVLEEQLGDPEENADLWRDRSAITHVENMERPIMMLHGVNDPRCPISQARLFRDALEEMGWEAGEDGDFEYVELGEEGHGSTDIDQKIRQFRLLVDYIDRRL